MRRGLLVMAAMATLGLASPAPAQDCAPFTDVPANDSFCANMQWMFNRGVTLGCAPNAYCPTDFVRRDQMAAFMNRLGNIVFQQGGNAFGATGVLGTTDGHALELRVNDVRVAVYDPASVHGPNVIVGHDHAVWDSAAGTTIAGGSGHFMGGSYTTIAGGFENVAGEFTASPQNAFATIGGGHENESVGEATTVAGGFRNQAIGAHATVPGGLRNIALGAGSFGAGSYAHADMHGCFVWGDTSTVNHVECGAPDRFVVRSLGGVYLYTGGNGFPTAYTGAALPAGANAWVVVSDRAHKQHFGAVDVRGVLDRLVAMPIATWNWKSQDATIRHIGPTAQDFHAAFGLGESDTTISTVDADGVALAAIQGLNAKLEAMLRERDATVERQSREIADLRRAVESLAAHVATSRSTLTTARPPETH